MATEAETEALWNAWLLERNRRGTKALLWIVLVFYPLFGVLDYLVAPRTWLGVLYATRAAVVLVTLGMFRVVPSGKFDRHPNFLSAGYMVLNACGISLMTVQMGGLASPYYAGLILAIVATGLLFVWPKHVVMAAHGAIILSFLLPNLLLGARSGGFTAVSNLFFLVSTGIISGTGQLLSYRSQREQIESRLVIESTKVNLERAHTQLQKLDRFKSEFFANITHELKTPLTMILAPLELLLHGEMGKITDAQRATLESMLRSGTKLLKLIGDLLDLSKLDESHLRLQVAEHDLVSYLRGLLTQVQPLAQRKAIDLSFETRTEACAIFCDIDRLERVFVNLLSNAAKFTPPEGRIRVVLMEHPEDVEVSVIDTGIGFPPEMADALFERFFQVDMAGTRKFGGTGIGLSLARELVRLHGGTLTAHSAESGGATFTVRLLKGPNRIAPDRIERRTRNDDCVSGKRESDRGIGDWQVHSTASYRLIEIDEATDQRLLARDPDEHERPQSVLVVDDTPDVIRVIHLALRRHFRVLAASGGAQGLELAVKHQPSLVITDLMMPDMDGAELTRHLRADPRTRHIPIVLLTARGEVEDRVSGLEAGVNAYLTKPFSTHELVSTVRGLVRIQETTADLVLTHSMDSLETIAGGLAHEINNPLNYIKTALSLIQADSDALRERVATERAPLDRDLGGRTLDEIAARLTRMFEVADGGLRRIGATVALMQRYSRDGYSRVIQPVDVFAAASDVARMLETGVERPLVTTSFDGDGQVDCVPEEVHQVLTNLVQNALDAIPRDGSGRVQVTGTGHDDGVVLCVKDNGTGIRPEDRARIFTPFFTTKDVGKGMGLGLTIVRRVVASLGGTVELASQVGEGTELTLRVPRRQVASARNGSL